MDLKRKRPSTLLPKKQQRIISPALAKTTLLATTIAYYIISMQAHFITLPWRAFLRLPQQAWKFPMIMAMITLVSFLMMAISQLLPSFSGLITDGSTMPSKWGWEEEEADQEQRITSTLKIKWTKPTQCLLILPNKAYHHPTSWKIRWDPISRSYNASWISWAI